MLDSGGGGGGGWHSILKVPLPTFLDTHNRFSFGFHRILFKLNINVLQSNQCLEINWNVRACLMSFLWMLDKFDVMTCLSYILMLWRPFWHHVVLSILMFWCHYFLRNDVHLDVLFVHFLTYFWHHNVLVLRYDVCFGVMPYFLVSQHTWTS